MPLDPISCMVLDVEISFHPRMPGLCVYVYFISVLPCSDNAFIMLRCFGHFYVASDFID